MKTLFVYYEAERVGVLTQDDEFVYSFSYEDSWLKNEKNFPLSLSMPLEQKDYGNKVTLSFFENLLPEGEVRREIEASHQVKGAFDFLAHFGQDCAGAITLTEDEKYSHHIQPEAMEEVDMSKVYKAIKDRESVAEVVADMNPGYLSLAGAQDKFPAIYKEGKFFLPTHGAPTTHIIKVPIWRKGIKESVYNEFYCMALAEKVGLNVPFCFVEESEYPLFIVERYDRKKGPDGLVHRIHQQDFCQAQGVTSEFKYESKGGPTLLQNYKLIQTKSHFKSRITDLQQFLDWICFNLLIGNNDSHSKNISFLMKDGVNALAPFYDLISTEVYSRLEKNFAFRIGNTDNFSRLGKTQFESLEKELEVKEGTFIRNIQKMNDAILNAKDNLAEEVLKKHPEAKIIPQISELIQKRSKALRLQGAY